VFSDGGPQVPFVTKNNACWSLNLDTLNGIKKKKFFELVYLYIRFTLWVVYETLKKVFCLGPLTSLTQPLITEVPESSLESEWSCICMLGVYNLPFSMILLFR
jgi:hypothetical protein